MLKQNPKCAKFSANDVRRYELELYGKNNQDTLGKLDKLIQVAYINGINNFLDQARKNEKISSKAFQHCINIAEEYLEESNLNNTQKGFYNSKIKLVKRGVYLIN